VRIAIRGKYSLLHAALFIAAIIGLTVPGSTWAQTLEVSAHFNQRRQVFRIDAADVSCATGTNDKKQVQTLYWGKRLDPADTLAATVPDPGTASFHPSVNTTKQEFVGSGGGLYVEPDLKVTFPERNRDLAALCLVRVSANRLNLMLKDAPRKVSSS
jgi:alpha-galactosidase